MVWLPASLMLISAIIHAAIGVGLKRSDDKLAFRAVLSVTSAALVLPFAFILPLPTAPLWPYLLLGAVVHFIYQVSQISAFDRADMSIVYPVMRGISPVLAGLFAYIALDETLTPLALCGLILSAGVLIAFGWPDKIRPQGFSAAIGFAGLCGVMIALYSVVDGAGMRLSRIEIGQVWTYLVWFFLLDCILITALTLARRRDRLRATFRAQKRWGSLAGAASLATFGLALYAFSLAPIAPMSAMRETSVVFGAIFAALILKEPFGQRRIALALLLCAGLILMQLG